jgi:hypothetical protein
MAHQLMSLLTPTACQAVEQHKGLYTRRTPDGKEEEMDGLTILVIILNRIRPHYKVDMYLEIDKLKKETLEQYDNNVDLYFDSIRYHKLQIDQKNQTAYADEQFVQDLFKQLKGEQLPSTFCLEFEHAEVKWLMNRENYTAESLMTELSLFYLNLKYSGGWKIETNKHQQIIALTTQLNEMETKLAKLTPKVGGATLPKTTTADTSEMKGRFPLWRLQKVPSFKEHCMIERDGAKWYWCEDGHSFENKPCGMYCMHKPDDGHIAWLARKEKFKKDNAVKKGNVTPTPSVTLPSSAPNAAAKSNMGDSSKLSLSKSLQSALMTKAGIPEDAFKKIWDEACASLGN